MSDLRSILQAQIRDLVSRIRSDDENTLVEWEEKHCETRDLIIARRKVRLELLFESHPTLTEEVRTEAMRRATDTAPFQDFHKDSMLDFSRASIGNVNAILETANLEDKIFLKQDNPSADVIAKYRATRDEEFRAILEQNTQLNQQILRDVKELDIDQIDLICLNGNSLEDYCFERDDGPDAHHATMCRSF